jgi:hypothetical protein
VKYPKALYVVEEGSGQDKFLASYKSIEEAVQGGFVGDVQTVALYRLVEVQKRTLVVK